METKTTILDSIKGGELPELPVSLEKSTIMYLTAAIFLMGVVLILFSKFINKL